MKYFVTVFIWLILAWIQFSTTRWASQKVLDEKLSPKYSLTTFQRSHKTFQVPINSIDEKILSGHLCCIWVVVFCFIITVTCLRCFEICDVDRKLLYCNLHVFLISVAVSIAPIPCPQITRWRCLRGGSGLWA